MCNRLSFCMVPASRGKPRRFLTDPNNIDNHSHTSIANANGFRGTQHDSLVQWEYRPIHPLSGCLINRPTSFDIYNPKAHFRLDLDKYPTNYIPTRADWAAACVFGKRLVTRYRNHPDRYYPRIQVTRPTTRSKSWNRYYRTPLSSRTNYNKIFLREAVSANGTWAIHCWPHSSHIENEHTLSLIRNILINDFDCRDITYSSTHDDYYYAYYDCSSLHQLCDDPERSFRKLLRLFGVKIPRNFDVGF